MKQIKNYSLEESQIKRLKDHYETTGIRMSEAVRKGVDLYFDEWDKQSERYDKTLKRAKDDGSK